MKLTIPWEAITQYSYYEWETQYKTFKDKIIFKSLNNIKSKEFYY